MQLKNLSVFFPLYNEEGNVEEDTEKAIAVLEKRNIDYEILLIDDGSKDKTGQIADELARENPKVRVIHHQKNLGYGEALKSGFYNAKYETIVYTDGDGQFDFLELDKFTEELNNSDLIIGYRIDRQDPIHRKIFAKGWALALLLFFRLHLKDVDCGFKMIKRRVLEKIPRLESTRGGMINAELAIKAKKYGFRIAQVGVHHYPRLFGKPTGANLNVIVQSFADLFKVWWRFLHKVDFFAFLGIIILASFFRFFNLSGYMTFLGDEGRDALVIKDLLTAGNIPFIGPPTSVGNMYLGPLYYYMMAVPMSIFWLNPVAAVAQIALIGIAIVVLIYYLARAWFGRLAGLTAAFLYAISPVTIIYSKSSWNPNPAPFFALLAAVGLYQINKTGNFFWVILTGVSLAAALQMHYLAFLLIPAVIILWLYQVKVGQNKKNLLSGTLAGIIAFFVLMSPLFIFDIRHNFMNYRAFREFFMSQGSLGFNPLDVLGRIWQIYSHDLIGRYMAAENAILSLLVSVLVIIPIVLRRSWPYIVLGTWLIVGLLGLSFYKQTIYDHYLGFLNPAPYILFGSLFVLLKRKSLKIGLTILLLALTAINLAKNPLFSAPNNQLKRTQEVAKFVINEAGNKDFNFALLSKNNYDSAYQFYLDQYGHKASQVPFDITDQLFVVCEDPICDPINNPKYEIAGFGWAKIDWKKELIGVKIFKLIPNPSGEP